VSCGAGRPLPFCWVCRARSALAPTTPLRRAPARPRSIETRLGGSADAHVDPKTRTAISGFGQSNALSEDGSGSSRTAGRPAIEAGRRSNGDSFCPKRLNNVSQRKRDQKEEIHVDQVCNHPSHLKY